MNSLFDFSIGYQSASSVFEVAYDPLEFGRELRAHRLQLGWSASQLVALYAEFVGREDCPPGPTFIYHIERGTTVVSQERRAILASLVGMPLATEQDSSTPLDTIEYLRALKRYCDQVYWQQGTLKHERVAIEARTNRLEAAAGHSGIALKRRLLQLLGFYQIVLAIALAGSQSALASALLSSTIERAKEEKFSSLQVYARIVRAGIYMDRFECTRQAGVLDAARRDINAAVKKQGRLPALYAGLLSVRKGLLDAYTARDKQEFSAALHQIAKGSSYIGASSDDKCIIARLDCEHCMLAKASAYLHSPMGDPKLGLAVLEELEREVPEPRGKSRLVQRHLLLALGLVATGSYPMAVAHLEAALENVPEDATPHLVALHARLLDTAFGNNPDVGRLAVKIHQMRHPEIFSFNRISLSCKEVAEKEGSTVHQ